MRVLRLGVVLAGVGLALALLSILLAVPPFHFGIWYQSEPVAAGLRVASGIAALGLGMAAWRGRAVRRALLHPYVLVPAALALLSMVLSFAQPFPYQGWVGSPEVGEGAIWYADLAILIAAAMVVTRVRPWRRLLLGLAVAVTVLVSVGTWLFFNEYPFPVVPYFFSDYLGFLGLSTGLAVAALWRAGAWVRYSAAAVLGLAVILVSGNNAAIGAALALIPLALAAWHWLPGGARRHRARIAAAAVFLLPVAMTAFVTLFDLADLAQRQDALGPMANSVKSRHHLVDVAWRAIAESPDILAVGAGWGRYADLLAIHLPVEWAVLMDDPLTPDDLRVAGWWDAVHRVDFHSHNFLIEGLLGAGLLGGALTLGVFAVLPLAARRRVRGPAAATALALAAVSAFWFMTPGLVACLALAMAGVARPLRRAPPLVGLGGVALAGVVLFGAATLAVGVENFRFAPHAHTFNPSMAPPLRAADGGLNCPRAFQDGGRGGMHLAYRLRVHVGFLKRRLNEEADLEPAQLDHLRGTICAAETYPGRDGMRLLTARLLGRSDLAFLARTTPRVDTLVGEYLTDWENVLREVLARAPRRTDLAVPYLTHLLSTGRDARLAELAGELYARNPHDPIAMWFTGLTLLGDGADADPGIQRMRDALEHGLERLMPVDAQIKTQLLGTGASPSDSGGLGPRTVHLDIETASGPYLVEVEVADTEAARRSGLQWRTSLPDGRGLLMVFEAPDHHSVWMKDTFVPLDLLFLSEDGRVVQVVENTQPESTREIRPDVPVIAILEVNAGTVADQGITVGAAVRTR